MISEDNIDLCDDDRTAMRAGQASADSMWRAVTVDAGNPSRPNRAFEFAQRQVY